MKSFLPKTLSWLIAIIISLSTQLYGQTFVYHENAQNHGIKIESSNKGAIVLENSIYQFKLDDVEINGQTMKHMHYDLSMVPSQTGAPDLPEIARYVLIPHGATVKLHVLNEEKVSYQNIEIAPAAAIPLENQETIPATKGVQYTKNAFFPAKRYQAETTEIRGMTMAIIGISPFQYNPVTKELVVYKNVEIEVEVIGGDGSYGEPRFRSKYWDQILDDLVFNEEDIPSIDYTKRIHQNKDSEGCDYLVLVPNNPEFISWADSIKLFRTEQGINTKIVTTEEIGGNTLDNIKDFMNTVYETWDPVPSGVLLMADYGNDANTITSKSYPHPYSGTYITDNYYADYTGNDLPDFVFARMTGRNAGEFETMVSKFIDYERTPPTDADFYDHPITALGWQTERWFQICSEAVGGYMTNVLGKETVRINAVYQGNPNSDPWSTATNTSSVVDYFGPNGQSYIPASPSELGGWTGGSANDVVNAINDGAFILQHRDHGAESGWGEPGFSMSNISQLNNVGKIGHIFSINCLTGRFDVAGECFAEKFHRYTNGGALSLTAATQVSYSFVNDTYVWGMFDNMWSDFLPDYGGNLIPEREFRLAFGSASGKYFLAYSNWPYNNDSKQITYRLFHHHGDAFGIIYTEVPEEMTIDYSEVMISGPDYMDVQAEEGAMIALSVDGELIGLGTGTGTSTPVNLIPQEPGTMIKIVITKQNYFRHEGFVQVIAPEGPYIVKSAIDVVDATGNNNGLIDFGEDISLDFSVKNLGTDIANNVSVTIATDDEYVTLNDATEDYGDVDVNETVMHEAAFSFSIADSIADNHSIPFSFTATNGTETWESSFTLKAYAPVLELQDMQITEVDGNGNGRIDAGEEANIAITMANSGRCATYEGLAQLFSTSDFITINNAEYSFESIDSLGTLTAEFNITTSDDTPIGTVIPIHCQVQSASYTVSQDYNFSVGLIVEDWETGDFSQFDWQSSGNADWTINTSVYYEGENSAKSGAISGNQSSSLSLDYESVVDDQISFFYKVSSESGYDYLRFYIDGSEKGSWSGEVAWAEASYDVTAGQHTFTWTYAKDGSVDGGSDCAWVDFIILPPMLLPTANAGDDAELCHTETSYQLSATATDYNSIEWSTSGDGSFSAIDITDPIYTFGTEDVNNGVVELSLTAHGDNGDVNNSMLIYIVNEPVQPALPQGDDKVCYAAQEVLYTIDDENTHYTWTISPENAGNITSIANNAYVSFNQYFSGEVNLSAHAYNACGESEESETLAIQVVEQSQVGFMGDAETCMGSEALLNLELVGEGPWTVEMMDENGIELIFDADVSPYEFGVNPDSSMAYTLMHITDANECIGVAEGTALVNVYNLPTATLTAEDAEVCGGDAIEVQLDLSGQSPWNIILGDTVNTQQSYEINDTTEIVDFIAPLQSMNLQILNITDDHGCIGMGEGSAAISVLETPVINLGPDTVICHHLVYHLDAQNEGDTYSWSTGADTQSIDVDRDMADSNGDALISVDVSNASGCMSSDEVLIHFKDCTGIDELSAEEIQLMPNPNNGHFMLEIPETNSEIISMSIRNSLGKEVMNQPVSKTENQMHINLSSLANGVYYLVLQTDEKQIIKRFVIRK